MLKIGLVFDDSLDRPDGVQQYVLAVGAWLAKQGHEVHYLVGQTARTDIPRVHSLARNVGVRFNGNRLTIPLPASTKKIRSLLARESFDVLHVMMPYSPFMAHKVIRLASSSAAIVGTFHILPQNRLVRWSTWLLGIWLRRTLQRFDMVFAVSSSARRFAESAFMRIRSRPKTTSAITSTPKARLSPVSRLSYQTQVEVLPNAIELGRFRIAKPLDLYNSGVHGEQRGMLSKDKVIKIRPLTIMFLGRLVPRKGCVDLLKAVYELSYNGPTGKKGLPISSKQLNFRLVICGKGPQEPELRAAAERYGIADKVEFAGFISEADKPRYIAAADIMVFPSTGGESFGIVLVEAMASGRPVVLAARNPGYATVMEPRPEQMFTPGDSRELAALLREYLQDGSRRQAAVVWQREYVRQFDIAQVGKRLEEEYLRQTVNHP